MAKIAGHFGVCFRGERGRFKLVSCHYAACAVHSAKTMSCFLSEVLWSNDVYYFKIGPHKTLEWVKRPISKVNGDSGEESCVGQTDQLSVIFPNKKRTTVRILRESRFSSFRTLSSLDQSPVCTRTELHSSNELVQQESNVLRILLPYIYNYRRHFMTT